MPRKQEHAAQAGANTPIRRDRTGQTIQALQIAEALLKIQTVIEVTGLSESSSASTAAKSCSGDGATREVALNQLQPGRLV